jgi:hypothetical protein
MDTAIRAANMAFAFALVGKRLPGEFAVRLACSLIAHGRFIVEHLEWSDELTGNHYLADIAGLAVLGCLIGGNVPVAEEWRKFACDELANEMGKQVYPDGWDFEASTAYHRLAMECFLIPAIMTERVGEAMDDSYRERLKLMAEFVRDITLPDGSFPVIGDNDSGVFMSLQPRSGGDLNYLLALSIAYLGNPSLKLEGVPLCPEVLWFMGDVGRGRFEAFESNERPARASYPDGGLYCLRSSDGGDLLTFRLGPVGQRGNGGHAHNDQLSVTIWFGGKPLVVDPGTPCYTSDPVKRNLYRSTRSHSTISIGGEEQSRFIDGNLFTLPQEFSIGDVSMHCEEEFASLEGSMRGYGPWWENEVRITRRVSFIPARHQVEIADEISLTGNARDEKTQWHFPLAPGLKVVESGPGQCAIVDDAGDKVAQMLYLPGWRLEMEETRFSPAYGEEVRNMTMRFTPPSTAFQARFIIRAVESR